MNRLISRVAFVLLVNAMVISPTAISPALAQDNNPLNLLKAPSAPVAFDVVDLPSTSLRFVGDDASLYLAGFQTAKQWQAFLQSDFAKHVLNSKLAQKWTAAFNDKWKKREGDIGQLRVQLDNPNLTAVIEVLGDLFHDEVFVYSDARLPNTILQINQLSDEVNVLTASAEDPEAFLEYLKSLDKDRFDNILVPTMVLGGKVANKDAVIEQLSILEGMVSVLLGQLPPEFARLAQGFKRIDDEAGSRLTMSVQSSMIPWETAEQFPVIGEMFGEVKRLTVDREFAITLGMLDEFLVFAISETKEDLLALRDVSSSLLDTPNLALVKEKSKLPMLGITYSSDAFAESSFETSFKNYFSKNSGTLLVQINTMIEDQLLDSEDPDDAIKAQKVLEIISSLPDDFQWLDEQIGQHVPKFLGQTGLTVARPDGVESWMQYRTKSVAWDSQPKLPILDHLGGKPLGFIAAKKQYHPEYFQTCRLIVQKIHTYLEKVSKAEVLDSEEEEEQLSLFLEKGWPLLTKFADIVEQDIIPATKDGQFAVVLTECNVKAKKFANDMVESKQDLPLPEFAKIIGTNDSNKLVGGFEKLYGLGDEVASVLHEVDESSVPEGFSVPRPESRSNPAGQNYFYPLPKEIGIPESILPQSLFAKDFAYFSYSGPQLAAILKPTPLSVTSSFLKEHKAIGAVVYVDVGRVFEQFKPWLLYSADQAQNDIVVPAEDGLPSVTKSDLIELYDAFSKIGEFVTVESGSDSGSVAHARHFR